MFLSLSDFLITLQWWGYLFVIGLIFFPLTRRIFPNFLDKGYPFAKIIGAVMLSYLVFVLGVTHIAPFTQGTIFGTTIGSAGLITLLLIKNPQKNTLSVKRSLLIIFEELLFLGGLLFWANIRAHQPDISGLEKYMDFGFVNSILRSTYFPPRDMWYTPLPINYYYFGHLITAVLTKLSGIPSFISFNLMFATLFAFTYSLSFSFVGNIWHTFITHKKALETKKIHTTETQEHPQSLFAFITSGIIGGFLVALSGNLHALYTLFTPYQNDSPLPFWQLTFSPKTFPNSYWYPNATRFIYHTIHEFPSYSFVVSDLHGHVLDIPLVITTIAFLFAITLRQATRNKQQATKKKTANIISTISAYLKLEIGSMVLLGFFLACMYMTNAWDGMIYFLCSVLVIFWKIRQDHKESYLLRSANYTLLLFGCFLLFALPFSLFFNPGALVGGIGLVCPPALLIHIGRIGPFVFETNHCMQSPLWQLLILYGFFLFWLLSFVLILIKQRKNLIITDIFVCILSGMAFALIIIPEFFYLRDIYTTYFRANTMFKLVYQSFIMLSLTTSYFLFRFLHYWKTTLHVWWRRIFLFPFLFIGLVFLSLVSIYSYFAVSSYYNNLSVYKGLNGVIYLATSYPTDAMGILWMNMHIKGQPVILEAQGDSYTEYARISANTGLPTVLGWPVHEWLWRGTYDIVPPRISDIQTMYETQRLDVFQEIAKKYHVAYVFVGQLERTKYPKLNELKLRHAGKIVFHEGNTIIYQISSL